MSKGRKTSYEERLEIVRYCAAHDSNYQKAAKVYEVSYNLVYCWVKKYDEGGEKALLDRRGKAKEEAALTELDQLKLENRKLLRKNRELEVENAVLKKLEELERRSRQAEFRHFGSTRPLWNCKAKAMVSLSCAGPSKFPARLPTSTRAERFRNGRLRMNGSPRKSPVSTTRTTGSTATGRCSF